MDPTDAARLWMQYIQPLKQYGVRLGGPAVTAGDTGRPWLQKFFAACGQCTIDFLPLHWCVLFSGHCAYLCSLYGRYGSGTAGFYDYLWTIRNQFSNTSVWVTEYADTSDDPTGASIRGSFERICVDLHYAQTPRSGAQLYERNHAVPRRP